MAETSEAIHQPSSSKQMLSQAEIGAAKELENFPPEQLAPTFLLGLMEASTDELANFASDGLVGKSPEEKALLFTADESTQLDKAEEILSDLQKTLKDYSQAISPKFKKMSQLLQRIEDKKAQMSSRKENKGRLKNAVRSLEGQIEKIQDEIGFSHFQGKGKLKERMEEIIAKMASAGLSIYATVPTADIGTQIEKKPDTSINLPPDVKEFKERNKGTELKPKKLPNSLKKFQIF
jgi:hypothetical protein